MTGKYKMIITKPWGHELIFALTKSYCGKILTINPSHRLSRQYHNLKEETFMVLKGTLSLEIDDVSSGHFVLRQLFLLKEGDTFHCPPKTIHRLCCDQTLNQQPLQLVEVSTNHLDDVVRMEDDYSR